MALLKLASISKMSKEGYFARSPFHSIGISLATLVLVAFVFWGSRVIHAGKVPGLLASGAILGLVLLPVVVWVWSMFLYLEMIRILPKQPDGLLRHSRLPDLHAGLILGVTLMSYMIIEELVRAVH